MFIDWAFHLSLLEHDPQANILKDFPLPVKRILVNQVVTFLQDSSASKFLSSTAHVSYALETVGQGFSLPIEEEDSISKAIKLYNTWTLEPTNRPEPINENQQFFMQHMLRHLSLIFEPRANTREGIEKHAQFCSKVLDIYVSIGRKIGHILSVETWELFLKLLIGVTDLILRPDFNVSQELLQNTLCSQLLRTLFELWLLSRTRNPDLWSALKQRAQNWTHHMALIQTWKFISIALTKRSCAILYGSSEGTESVIISADHDSIQKINLEDEYVFYSWHRMLNLIGNPNETIKLPFIFLDFMTGVEIIVNQYLKIGFSKGQENTRYIAPTANTILHIFGVWLFDAVHLNRNNFEEGTSLALKTLTTVITQKHETEFLPCYSSNFFSCMRNALSQDGRVLITAILTSVSIFTLNIKGIRCLLPFYVGAIHRISNGLSKLDDNVMAQEHVRRESLKILGTIISLPNQFSNTKFYLENNNIDIKATRYKDLKDYYSSIIFHALESESYEPNIETLLRLSYIWSHEIIHDKPDFIRKILKTILSKIKHNSWTPNVTKFALKTLSEMSIHYSNLGDFSSLISDQVVQILCTYIIKYGNPCTPPQDDITVLTFKCIVKWIITKDQWIFAKKETLNLLLSAIVIGITGKNSNEKNIQNTENTQDSVIISNKIRRIKDKRKEEKLPEITAPELSKKIIKQAQFTLSILLNNIGNFPAACGPASYSSLASEEYVLKDMISNSKDVTFENSGQFCRYFITDNNVIICVIDRRGYDKNGKPSVCIIVRNETGRYTWDTQISFLPLNNENEKELNNTLSEDEKKELNSLRKSTSLPEKVNIVTEPHICNKNQLQVNDLGNVMSFLGQENSGTSAVINIVKNQVENEHKLLQSKDFNLNVNISVKKTTSSLPQDSCLIAHSRMFLSHIGFLALENRDKLYPLKSNSTFFTSLKQLDKQSERICIRVGVVYFEKGQSEKECFGNEGGNLDYQQFIATLGWGIDITKHSGFTGTLDVTGNITGSKSPYWADYSTEIIFQTCTLMPNNSTYADHAHKRKQSINANCIVIWAEDLNTFQPTIIWNRLRHNALLITITPLENGLYLVRLFSKSNDISFGPLIDGIILRKEILGPLIRDTAINAWQVFENPNNILATQPRAELIQKINSQFKQTDTLEEFYVPLFTNVTSDFVSPLGKKRMREKPKLQKSKEGKLALNMADDSEDVSKKERRQNRKKDRKKRKVVNV